MNIKDKIILKSLYNKFNGLLPIIYSETAYDSLNNKYLFVIFNYSVKSKSKITYSVSEDRHDIKIKYGRKNFKFSADTDTLYENIFILEATDEIKIKIPDICKNK
ncbi:MAG TPA: hypothetical protein PLS66_05070 [Tepiditoga sp.]|nr:hypothetical protein [Tepiditoga sp.]